MIWAYATSTFQNTFTIVKLRLVSIVWLNLGSLEFDPNVFLEIVIIRSQSYELNIIFLINKEEKTLELKLNLGA